MKGNLKMETQVIASQPKPPKFKESFVEHCFELPVPEGVSSEALHEKAWAWLNSKETFQNGQIFPFRVEFVREGTPEAPFEVGTYTNHHGPLLNANGVITQMVDIGYRELRYFYGSYVLSFRAIRPVNLEFWVQDQPFSENPKEPSSQKKLYVKVKMHAYVHPWIFGLFESTLTYFWKRFEFWMKDSLNLSKKAIANPNQEVNMETSVQKISQKCKDCGKELNYDTVAVTTDEAFAAQVLHVNQIYKIEDQADGRKCIKNRSVLLCDKVGCSQPHVMVLQPK